MEQTLSDSEQLVQSLVRGKKGGQLVKVLSVESSELSDVYCLDAAITHAFCVEGGILVHNCYDEACHMFMARPIAMPEPKLKIGRYDRRIEELYKKETDSYEDQALFSEKETYESLGLHDPVETFEDNNMARLVFGD